jgi:hypothetical protein
VDERAAAGQSSRGHVRLVVSMKQKQTITEQLLLCTSCTCKAAKSGGPSVFFDPSYINTVLQATA